MIWIPLIAAWYSMKVNQMEWERLHGNSTANHTKPRAEMERRSELLGYCDAIKTDCEALWTSLNLPEQGGVGAIDCEDIGQYGPDCLYRPKVLNNLILENAS